MAQPAIDEISYAGLDVFYRDLAMIVSSTVELDKYYALGRAESDAYILRMKKAVSQFNKKYRDVVLSLRITQDTIDLSIALKGEESIQTFFSNSAARIKGLSGLGIRAFNEVSVGEQDKLQSLLERVRNRLFISYSDPEAGNAGFWVEKKGNSIMLNCNIRDLYFKSSPEFKVLSYYALRKPIKKSVDVLSHAASIGFYHGLVLEHSELEEQFDPIDKV